MRNSCIRGLLTLSAATVLAWPALAASQDESLDSLDSSMLLDEEALLFQNIPSVYGASKYEQKVTEAPSSVSIVTADEIRKYGYRTLNDVLESLRGFIVTDDRNYSYVSARGFGQPGDYNTRLLLLLDGRRLNDNIFDAAFTGRIFPVDVDLIDRVEVIRGPSSSLYGANAFFGVINVITKRGRDLQGPEVAAAYGHLDTKEGRVSYGDRFQNGIELLMSGTYFDTEGNKRLYFREFDDPATNNGVAENLDGEQAESLFTKLTYADFTLEGAYVSRDKDIPTASYETVFNDPRNRTVDEQLHLNLRYEHSFANQIDVVGDLFYQRADYDGDYPYDYSEDDEPYIVVYKDYAYGRWWGGELQFTVNALEGHRIVFGTEVQRNERQDQGNYDDQEVYLDDQQDSTDWGVYLQDEFKLRDDLILNAGVRHDDHEDFDSTTNPRFALIYNPTVITTIKLLYGTAFRAPNVYELYFHDNEITAKAAQNLEPETIETWELILEQSIGQHWRAVAGVFRYEVDDLITLTTDPADDLLVFDNTDSVEAHGVELELEGKRPSGWAGRLSYTYQDTEDQVTGATLPNSPKHLAKGNLIAPLIGERLFAGLELQYTDTRKNVRGTHIDDFTIANLTLHAPGLWKGLDLSAGLYNVFDKKYSDPGSEEHTQEGIEQDGISYRVKAYYAF
ncbi:MAG: TonB-dependent receptor [Gammaproteobacteria bacterium]|nr:TonB-dependent receptor [Gammaproteobacteria bacterium]